MRYLWKLCFHCFFLSLTSSLRRQTCAAHYGLFDIHCVSTLYGVCAYDVAGTESIKVQLDPATSYLYPPDEIFFVLLLILL